MGEGFEGIYTLFYCRFSIVSPTTLLYFQKEGFTTDDACYRSRRSQSQQPDLSQDVAVTSKTTSIRPKSSPLRVFVQLLKVQTHLFLI